MVANPDRQEFIQNIQALSMLTYQLHGVTQHWKDCDNCRQNLHIINQGSVLSNMTCDLVGNGFSIEYLVDMMWWFATDPEEKYEEAAGVRNLIIKLQELPPKALLTNGFY